MYRGVIDIYARYWRIYGGSRALVRSPYFHAALLLSGITCHYWLTEKWWEQSLSVLPNLLGFSLGGFAMFLGFGNERFRAILSEKDTDSSASAYLNLCTSFVHFILIQLLALIFAITAKALAFEIAWPVYAKNIILLGTYAFDWLGYLLFLYSITSMAAATMTVFRMCSWYEKIQQSNNQ